MRPLSRDVSIWTERHHTIVPLWERLDQIEADIRAHPERICTLDGALLGRLKALVANVECDLEAPLLAELE